MKKKKGAARKREKKDGGGKRRKKKRWKRRRKKIVFTQIRDKKPTKKRKTAKFLENEKKGERKNTRMKGKGTKERNETILLFLSSSEVFSGRVFACGGIYPPPPISFLFQFHSSELADPCSSKRIP